MTLSTEAGCSALIEAGVVSMSSAYTLWFDPEQERNRHTRIVWRQTLYDIDGWAIPKGTPKRDDAYRFIAFASSPEPQKVLSEQLTYGPTNRHALDLCRHGSPVLSLRPHPISPARCPSTLTSGSNTGDHSGPNMASLASGESGELIWKFTRTGPVVFACLQSGHGGRYEGRGCSSVRLLPR